MNKLLSLGIILSTAFCCVSNSNAAFKKKTFAEIMAERKAKEQARGYESTLSSEAKEQALKKAKERQEKRASSLKHHYDPATLEAMKDEHGYVENPGMNTEEGQRKIRETWKRTALSKGFDENISDLSADGRTAAKDIALERDMAKREALKNRYETGMEEEAMNFARSNLDVSQKAINKARQNLRSTRPQEEHPVVSEEKVIESKRDEVVRQANERLKAHAHAG